MIAFIRNLTQHRTAWAVLFGSAFFLELCAMVFQHIMGLQPCVMHLSASGRSGDHGLCSDRFHQPQICFCAGRDCWQGAFFSTGVTDRLKANRYSASSVTILIPAIYLWPFQTGYRSITGCHGFSTVPVIVQRSNGNFLSWTMPQWLIVAFGAYTLSSFVIIAGNLVRGKCCSS